MLWFVSSFQISTFTLFVNFIENIKSISIGDFITFIDFIIFYTNNNLSMYIISFFHNFSQVYYQINKILSDLKIIINH